MPAHLRNDEAEELLLEIRTARNVARQVIGDEPGAFLVFPTSVVISAPTGGQAVYPVHSEAEPGDLVRTPGTARVSAMVAGIAVTGQFHWVFGEEPPIAARYRFHRRGRDVSAPPWVDQLTSSCSLVLSRPADLARQQGRLQRRGRGAENRLLTLSDAVFRAVCRGPIRQVMQYRPALDADDVVQRGLQAACRLLPLYSSPERPPCSWGAMLRLDGRRDMHREVAWLDGFSEDAAAALSLAKLGQIRCHADPAATLADLVSTAARLGRAAPRISAPALDAALRAPEWLAWAQAEASAATVPGPEAQAFDRACGCQGQQVVATVARLISDDSRLIASAVEGDPDALRRVGNCVVGRLRHDRESRQSARHRCWEEFRSSGQLFAGQAGLQGFSGPADPALLAALDDHLRQAAGLGPAAASR